MSIWLLLLLAFVISFAYAGIRAAPWVPLHARDVERVVTLMDLKGGEVVYDIGCGDGRILAAAAEKGAQATGFEVSLLPYLLAQIRRLRGKKFRVRFKDFWWQDLRQADVVFFFLMPKIFPKLKEKLERELKPGARVISYVWPIDGWEPTRVDRREGSPALYLYLR